LEYVQAEEDQLPDGDEKTRHRIDFSFMKMCELQVSKSGVIPSDFTRATSSSARRLVKVAISRTDVPSSHHKEWAQFIRRLSDECYPNADKLVLVMDNLTTHTLASLSEVFPVAEARRLSQRFEVYDTPKHGSPARVLAEIELSALDRQCLWQRLASLEQAQQQVAAWTTRRHQQQLTITWRFTAQDASLKLKHLYPSISD
jgi:hypothetical protein